MIDGMGELLKKLENYPDKVKVALGCALEQTLLKTEADARKRAPVNAMSQAYSGGVMSLRQGITRELDSEALQGRVVCKAPHAAYVELGTGPVGAANHEGISPNVNPAYTERESWVYPIESSAGIEFRRTSGQPARPFLYPAAVENKDFFKATAENKLREAAQGI